MKKKIAAKRSERRSEKNRHRQAQILSEVCAVFLCSDAFHALADSCHREADSYYLYGDSGREAEIVFRSLLAQQGDSAEGCHFRGACLFHADRTVCSNALRTGEVWSG